MLRITIEKDSRRIGSLFVNGVELELHARDEDAYLEALAFAFGALNGRDCARTLGTVPAVCQGCVDGTIDNHIYGHGEIGPECSVDGRSAVLEA